MASRSVVHFQRSGPEAICFGSEGLERNKSSHCYLSLGNLELSLCNDNLKPASSTRIFEPSDLNKTFALVRSLSVASQ